MKSYIQDLCGDENPIDIDLAILQCLLQDAMFEKLLNAPMKISVETSKRISERGRKAIMDKYGGNDE